MTLDQNIPKPPSGRSRESARKKQEFLTFYAPADSATLSYARLLHFLIEIGLVDQTVFLSMNYDILLDRVLYASETHVPDYWIDAFYDVPKPETSERGQHSGVLLLKLHGSLNWRVCDSCHVLRNLKEFAAWPKDKCIDCGASTARPMLIRPTLSKTSAIASGGCLAEGGACWVFIGYSLPMADVWMLRLLAQSARSGGISTWDRKITVVNRDPRVRRRFSFLFPKMDFREEDFNSWITTCRNQGGLAFFFFRPRPFRFGVVLLHALKSPGGPYPRNACAYENLLEHRHFFSLGNYRASDLL